MARGNGNINQKNTFLILTNGKKTEVNYFELIKKNFKSFYKVKIEFQNLDPYELVKYAKGHVEESNQVWVVFDVDNTYHEGKFNSAIMLADKENVKYAFSNKSFEVWLLSHFCKVESNFSNKELIEEINQKLKEQKFLGEYIKGDVNILKKCFIFKYRDAVTNSKIIFQKKLKDHNELNTGKPKYWEWCSSTTVYKLIEALKLSK